MDQRGFRQGTAVRRGVSRIGGVDPQGPRTQQGTDQEVGRLSGEVIDKYKAGGPGWQSRIDADFRRLNNIK
jgi:hypothetical protein